MHRTVEAPISVAIAPEVLAPHPAAPRRLRVHLSRFPRPVAPATSATEERARRFMNVTLAAVALVVCAPLMLVIAVLIKLTSPGPILYTQTRVGVDRRAPGETAFDRRRKLDFGGRLFRIYKFRTMRVASDRLVQIWAQPNDSRVTALGGFLRRSRLDELPQLFNVLKGDMNLVGPRPEQPNIFMTLREQIEHYPDRQRVLPGITGWAQINNQYDRSIDDVRTKLLFDLQYIERHSLMYDLRILLNTIPVVLFRRGAW